MERLLTTSIDGFHEPADDGFNLDSSNKGEDISEEIDFWDNLLSSQTPARPGGSL